MYYSSSLKISTNDSIELKVHQSRRTFYTLDEQQFWNIELAGSKDCCHFLQDYYKKNGYVIVCWLHNIFQNKCSISLQVSLEK